MEELISWFKKYKSLSIIYRTPVFEKDNSIFLNGFRELKKSIDEEQRIRTDNYNVFQIIKYIADKEELFHSPFLADLLNPEGKHRQGRLFFDEFFNQLSFEFNKEKFDFKGNYYFFVETEKWTGDGAIDIIIELQSANNSKRFAIAIENKIFAKDQPQQLERYASYLEQEYGKNYILVYLTPYPRTPEENSISKERLKEMLDYELMKLITYETHITQMLLNSSPNIKSSKIYSIINQYLLTIKNNFKNG